MEIFNDGQTLSDQRDAIKDLVWMTRHFMVDVYNAIF